MESDLGREESVSLRRLVVRFESGQEPNPNHYGACVALRGSHHRGVR